MSEQPNEVDEVEDDWLPEESKKVVRDVPDYQRLIAPCESCQ